MYLCFLVLASVLLTTGIAAEIPSAQNRSEFKRSFDKECQESYSMTCLKMDIVQWVDKLSESKDFSVLPGVTIIKESTATQEKNNVVVAKLAREFPNDPETRLDAYVIKKITGYLGSHSIKLNLFDSKSVDQAFTARKDGGFGGGKGDKKGGGMGMLLAMGGMMKMTMFGIALAGLAALAGKALMTGLISLMLSGIIGLKSLTSGGHSTTYEVVSKPIHTSHHTHSVSHEDHGHGHGHSGYGRSFDELPKGLQPDYKPY